jgi:hypothetical protein
MEYYKLIKKTDSWKALTPKKNPGGFSELDESIDEYHMRLKERFSIPFDVLKQWLYCLFYDRNTVTNYGWLNYDKIEFTLIDLSLNELKNVRIINNFKSYVEERTKAEGYCQLTCTEKDKKHWQQFNTWRIPPIILDVNSLNMSHKPEHADIKGDLQLVEGHTRLGYLYAISNSKLYLKDYHKVYLMRKRNM